MKPIVFFMIFIALSGQAQWYYETVQTGIANYSKSYINLDPSGNPCIAYLPCYTGNLRYARKSGSVWSISTVANDAYTTAGGPTLALCLAFNGDGFPYITYTTQSANLHYLKLAYFNGTIWNTVNIDGPQVTKAALTFDIMNNLWLGYQYNTYQKSATYQGGGWIFDSIGPGSWLIGKVSLCCGTDNSFHYAYDNGSYIIYANRLGASWNIDTVDQGGWTSMALNRNNHPYIAYTKPFNRNLWYAYFNGTTWIQALVDSGGGSGPGLIAPSIGVDGQGHVHIAYLQQTSTSGIYRLKYAHFDGSNWRFEVVDSGFAWHVPSLTVTSLGSPHIAYFNGTALLYASREPLVIFETGKNGDKAPAKNVIVMPNPFINSTVVQGAENEIFLVYDIGGRKVGEHRGDRVGEELAPGVYFIISREKIMEPVRIVKIK